MLRNFARLSIISILFQNQLFQKNYFINKIKVSDSLDPNQALCFVSPNLGQNCLKCYQQMTLAGKEFKSSKIRTKLFSHITRFSGFRGVSANLGTVQILLMPHYTDSRKINITAILLNLPNAMQAPR